MEGATAFAVGSIAKAFIFLFACQVFLKGIEDFFGVVSSPKPESDTARDGHHCYERSEKILYEISGNS